MSPKASWVLYALLTWVVCAYASRLRANILKAQKTGLPYIVTPIHPTNGWWQLSYRLWAPLIRLLPKPWWEEWLFVMQPGFAFVSLYGPFAQLGDPFLVVSFDNITLFVSDASVIRQIASRREAFPKPVVLYKILEIFGENVVTTEGPRWRMHRKVTASSFNERNTAHTFAEAIVQAQSMLAKWFPDDDAVTTETIRTMDEDTMTLAMNIIAYVGFGLRLLWPGQPMPADADSKLARYGSREPPEGFTLGFVDAVAKLLTNLIVLILIPAPLLRFIPAKFAREGREGMVNYAKYIDHLLQEKRAAIQRGEKEKDGMDLLGQLARAKYGETQDGAWMTDDNITGNAFIMFVAGHETTANSLHFTLLELANNPPAQRRLQKDLDQLFGNSDPATWKYEQNINAMLGSHLGACINETLRTMPAVNEIPKVVAGEGGQSITVNGKVHHLPAGLNIQLNAVGAGRNPRYWPSKPSRITGDQSDLNDWVPDRWYCSSSAAGEMKVDIDQENFNGGFRGQLTSAALFRPAPGSFLAFSEGARSCLGRRIAQVEMTAALAVFAQKCTIELAVDEWATDDQVERMHAEERAAVYAKAQAKSRQTIREATSLLTLKLHSGKHVPVRVVMRGHERFVNAVER